MTYYHFGEAMFGLFAAAWAWRHQKQAQRIEVLVNGRLDQAISRIEQLEAEMAAHNVPIPPGQPSVAP